ncbi:MAG: NUDIX domain-containing protein [Treponema sp.]|nr:NUDIX domain-containing protein [Treponema sp.]
MEMNAFNFCPLCGSRKIETVGGGRKWKCPDCSMELYNNIASAVGLIITDGSGRVLLEKRAKNPRKGYLALPGGFTDADESAEEAAIRECIEELGVEPVNLKYLCSYPNTYEFGNFTYKTCDLFFTAELPEKFEIRTQESEVAGLEAVKIETEEDVEKCPLAFESARKTLKKWILNGRR